MRSSIRHTCDDEQGRGSSQEPKSRSGLEMITKMRHNPVTSSDVCGDKGGAEPWCGAVLRVLTWCPLQSGVLLAPRLR